MSKRQLILLFSAPVLLIFLYLLDFKLYSLLSPNICTMMCQRVEDGRTLCGCELMLHGSITEKLLNALVWTRSYLWLVVGLVTVILVSFNNNSKSFSTKTFFICFSFFIVLVGLGWYLYAYVRPPFAAKYCFDRAEKMRLGQLPVFPAHAEYGEYESCMLHFGVQYDNKVVNYFLKDFFRDNPIELKHLNQ